jgi:UDP:flavonoid glycosyltransferase YjiC (YdhE family)
VPDVLIASVPIHGHVSPLLAVAAGLVHRGYRVRFLTGARFEASVRETGAEFVPLPPAADYDDRTLGDRPDDDVKGVAAIRRDVRKTFLAPARSQYDALLEQLRQPTDAVIPDPTFVGALLLAGHTLEQRPPIVAGGVLPLGLRSAFVPPFGLGLPPWRGPLNRVRNALLTLVTEKLIFRSIQRDVNTLFRSVHGHDAGAWALSWLTTVDAVVQFTVPSFEYPRPDATVPLYFAGPVATSSSATTPDWWPDLRSGRPVVHVTQGTIANADFGQLVLPTVTALVDEDVVVVVATGGRPVSDLGPLPPNVRAAEFLPYDELLPLTDVLVTNGGYGGVQFALQHGVPVVVAGDTEDKPEVANRVAFAGAGLNLRTGTPSEENLRRAVRQILAERRFRDRAASIASEMSHHDGPADAARLIEQLVATGAPVLRGRARRDGS